MDDDEIDRRLDDFGRRIDQVDANVGALRHDLQDALAFAAVRDLCLELIDPLDAVDRLLAAPGSGDPELVNRHVRSVAATLRGVLRRMGAEVEPIRVGVDLYDADQHRCVAVVEPTESPFPAAPPHTVVRILEDGYLLRRRRLRPALVEIQGDRHTPTSTRGGAPWTSTG
ncbi:nucleotide exchange factor GrpE [Actinoplanes sp. NBC_00393]|uniref:nucleotide exchange factor GrpE n=1 Tax=Actinoplanes sp. NBC_00393 TaxID=2975953 RepID=UPI002E23A791